MKTTKIKLYKNNSEQNFSYVELVLINSLGDRNRNKFNSNFERIIGREYEGHSEKYDWDKIRFQGYCNNILSKISGIEDIDTVKDWNRLSPYITVDLSKSFFTKKILKDPGFDLLFKLALVIQLDDIANGRCGNSARVELQLVEFYDFLNSRKKANDVNKINGIVKSILDEAGIISFKDLNNIKKRSNKLYVINRDDMIKRLIEELKK